VPFQVVQRSLRSGNDLLILVKLARGDLLLKRFLPSRSVWPGFDHLDSLDNLAPIAELAQEKHFRPA